MARVMFWHGWAWTKSIQDDLASEDPYQFQPLGTSTTIRLIKVSPERVNGCIACKIYHFDENQQRAIKYHALSYLWGDAKHTQKIYVQDRGKDRRNGWHPFPLHENLWQFLDHAWRHKMFDQLFWTDYLCLDQKGHEEIAQQVPRMHAIYRNAELVVIWLQMEQDDYRALCKVVRLRRLQKLMQRFLRTWIDKRLDSYRYEIWDAMERNPYWWRIWIVQEVVVATTVCVKAGDISIDFEWLRVFVEPYRETDLPAGTPSTWVLCDMREVGGKMPLWRILREFTGYQSSRPSDRVYGLLGLVEDHEDGSSPVGNIQVDYDRPTSHVLLDAIFESSPPLTELTQATLCLGPRDTYDSLSLLEDYIGSSSTTQRHRDLAKLALQTFEAFRMIKKVPTLPFSFQISDHDIESAEPWQPTSCQSAALIGLVLASHCGGSHENWKAHRRDVGSASFPWRCALHRSHDRDCARPVSYQPVCLIKTWVNSYGLGVVNACAEQSQSCDGTIMTLEIPGIQLRLTIEFVLDRDDGGWLRLERMGLEP